MSAYFSNILAVFKLLMTVCMTSLRTKAQHDPSFVLNSFSSSLTNSRYMSMTRRFSCGLRAMDRCCDRDSRIF